MPISAVLFDLDGTLHDRNRSVLRLIEDQYERFPELEGVYHTRYVDRFMELDQRGYVGKDVVYAQLAQEFRLSDELQAELEADFYAQYAEYTVGFPGLHEVLQELMAMDLRLGLLTNGGEKVQTAKLEALGIRGYFEVVGISAALNMRKPDLAIFEWALSELEVSAEEAVFVGDHPVSDIAGAQAAGMSTIWFKDDAYWGVPVAPGMTIESLFDLPVAVRRLSLSTA
jgi:putative hydrolase of the HAD superfamily